MSCKRVTQFFKPTLSKTNEEVNTNPKNVEEENDSPLNKKQDEETDVLKEGEPFHPPKAYVFPKTRIGDRDRSCQQHWFNDFPWLHYDERYINYFI